MQTVSRLTPRRAAQTAVALTLLFPAAPAFADSGPGGGTHGVHGTHAQQPPAAGSAPGADTTDGGDHADGHSGHGATPQPEPILTPAADEHSGHSAGVQLPAADNAGGHSAATRPEPTGTPPAGEHGGHSVGSQLPATDNGGGQGSADSHQSESHGSGAHGEIGASVEPPRAAVLGTFAGVNGLVLLGAGIARRRGARSHRDRSRAARNTAASATRSR